RVVLDLHGKPLVAGNETGATGDGPALHDAIELEAKIVMQPSCRMLLDHELVAGGFAARAARVGRYSEITLSPADFERHDSFLVSSAGERGIACRRGQRLPAGFERLI